MQKAGYLCLFSKEIEVLSKNKFYRVVYQQPQWLVPNNLSWLTFGLFVNEWKSIKEILWDGVRYQYPFIFLSITWTNNKTNNIFQRKWKTLVYFASFFRFLCLLFGSKKLMAYFLKLQEVIAQTTDNAEKPGCAEESLVHFVPVEVSKKRKLTIKRWTWYCK